MQVGWSPRLRHPDISIYRGLMTRSAETKWSMVCCLADAPANTIKAKIVACRLYVLIGLCHKSAAESYSFEQSDWTETGHGHYCLSSNGGVLSHSDSTINWNTSKFQFKQGDVLHLQLDAINSKLVIHKQNQTVLMDLEQGDYVFCAYLWHIGDSIELLPVDTTDRPNE